MTTIPRYKVFISYHHEQDQRYKDQFVRMMGTNIIDHSVDTGDIVDSNIRLDETRRQIRDDYIAAATVTVVLIGRCTWKRKHVDWEIAASLSDTQHNDRCGLLGILLPTHPNHGERTYNSKLIPPRLADNTSGDNPFACIYDLPENPNPSGIREWIHRAFIRRSETPYPDNGRPQFGRNWRGRCADGWQGQVRG